MGWGSLLRTKPTESVASTKILLLELSGEEFIEIYRRQKQFAEWFNNETVIHELIEVSRKFTELQSTLEPTWKEDIEKRTKGGRELHITKRRYQERTRRASERF